MHKKTRTNGTGDRFNARRNNGRKNEMEHTFI